MVKLNNRWGKGSEVSSGCKWARLSQSYEWWHNGRVAQRNFPRATLFPIHHPLLRIAHKAPQQTTAWPPPPPSPSFPSSSLSPSLALFSLSAFHPFFTFLPLRDYWLTISFLVEPLKTITHTENMPKQTTDTAKIEMCEDSPSWRSHVKLKLTTQTAEGQNTSEHLKV